SSRAPGPAYRINGAICRASSARHPKGEWGGKWWVRASNSGIIGGCRPRLATGRGRLARPDRNPDRKPPEPDLTRAGRPARARRSLLGRRGGPAGGAGVAGGGRGEVLLRRRPQQFREDGLEGVRPDLVALRRQVQPVGRHTLQQPSLRVRQLVVDVEV